MKNNNNYIRTFMLGTLVFTAVSCVSKPSVINRIDISPAVMLSVTSNQKISWTDTTSDTPGLLGNVLTKNSDSPSVTYSRTQPLLQFALQSLLERLPNSVEMPNAMDVLSLDSYKESAEDFLMKRNSQEVIDGWRIYSSISKNVIQSVTADMHAKSAVFIAFKFGRTLTEGDKRETDQIDDEVYFDRSGYTNADVTMDVVITDTEGKRIFKERYHAMSKKGIRTKQNEYDYKRFVGYFEEPILSVIDSFASSIIQ